MKKIVWGVLSIVPMGSLLLTLINAYSFMREIAKDGGEGIEDILFELSSISGWFGFVGLVTLGVTIAFIIHALTNNELRRGERIGWSVLILLGNILLIPIYWGVIIMKRRVNTEKEDNICMENSGAEN